MTTRAQTVRPGPLLAVLAVAGIIAALMQTLVVPIIGQLPTLLHTTASTASWVVTVTLLTAAVTTPIVGRLGDMFGKRPLLLASVGMLVTGSAVCAVSSSVVPMIVGRGLQGMGVGVIPLAISVLRDLLPPDRLTSGIALVSASLGIGGALGLPVSAAIVEQTSWHALFWISTGLAGGVGVLLYLVLPNTPPVGPAGRFDPIGAIGLGIALVCLLLAVSKGSLWGWTSGSILALFGGALVMLCAWAWWELRTGDPLVDLRVSARPQVLFTNLASILLGMAMYAQSLLLPQLLQLPAATGYGLSQSMMAMGWWMAPAGITMMAFSPIGARLTAAHGAKTTLITGSMIIAVGYLASLLLMGTTWGVLTVTVVINIGVGFGYGAIPALIMGAVPQSETAAANSFNTLMRSMGTAIAAAGIGAVLAQLSTSLGGHVIPTEKGFQIGMLLGGGVALGAAIIALLIPRRPQPISVPVGEQELVGA
ncbi:MFS transporter [Nocardia goodfellowii]